MPTHEQSKVVPLNTILIKGFWRLRIFSTKRMVLVISLLVFSNFFFSYFSLLKARITRRPVRFSRVRRVILSSNFWKILNFGTTSAMMVNTKIRIAPADTAIIQVMSGAVSKAMTRAKIQNIGARISIDKIIVIACWTWLMSLVVRVMSEAVLKFLVSARSRLITFLKISWRRSLEKLAPMRAAKRFETSAPTADSTARPSIKRPVRQIKSMLLGTMPSLIMSAMRAGKRSVQ